MLEQIRNYYCVSDSIATAGQPTANEFNFIKKAGFDVVINLALPDSPHAIKNEEALVKQTGMDYVHIPVDFKAPTSPDLQLFFDAMDNHKDKKSFIHCALNMRVSAFIFLYKIMKQQWPVQEALLDLHAVWKPDETWQDFIDRSLAQHNIEN